jgi:hypothetical protein
VYTFGYFLTKQDLKTLTAEMEMNLTISNIPDEILTEKVFLFLDDKTMFLLPSVSKAWKSFAETDTVWRQLCIKCWSTKACLFDPHLLHPAVVLDDATLGSLSVKELRVPEHIIGVQLV